MHWTVHLDEFFDHHLKGAPCPGWMEKGVLYTERGMREIASLFQGEKAATPAAGGEQ
jgi:hypothetical protein